MQRGGIFRVGGRRGLTWAAYPDPVKDVLLRVSACLLMFLRYSVKFSAKLGG